VLSVFRLIDQYAHGQVNLDNLRLFMARFPSSQDVDEMDLTNWITRYDKDVDGGLKFTDLVETFQTLSNYQPKVV